MSHVPADALADMAADAAPDAREPGPRTTAEPDLGSLLWLRSLMVPHHCYVESATGDRTLTYGDLGRATGRWRALLDDLGVPPGATVGIVAADPLDFVHAFLGVIAAGRVAGPLDPRATDAELVAVCDRVGPHLVVADRAAPVGAAGRAGRSGWDWVQLLGGAFGLASAPRDGPGDGPGSGGGRGGGLVLSTSGTTGAPKLIRLDERRLLHTARTVAAHHELSAVDRGFSPLPLFHVNAEVVGLLATLVAGATVVLDDRFHRRGFWEAMARHRVTWLNAVPAILARLVPLEPGEALPATVRFARSASAPLPVAVLERFEAATGIPVVETYGMTEAASQVTANPLRGAKAGSVGRPTGAEVRVVRRQAGRGAGTEGAERADGAPPGGVGRGAVGRVEIRGPGVISGYAGPGYEDRFDPEGWLDTGDLGYVDDDGYLFLVGRADDVINRGGEKIHPREVEEVLLAEPGVAAVAVVGGDHAVLGRVPVAYVVGAGIGDAVGGGGDGTGAGDRAPSDRERAAALVARLVARAEAELSRPKRPAAFHVVGRLPQGPTGKVRRCALGGGGTAGEPGEPGAPVYSLLVS